MEHQPLQPAQADVDKLYHLSSEYWFREADSALDQLENGLDLRCFQFQSLLGRVPPLPDKLAYGLTRSCCSEWRVTGSANCWASGRSLQATPVHFHWYLTEPTKVTLSGDRFRTWTEIEGNKSNLIAILVPAWSYILSARLVELQGQEGCHMIYTESTAPECHASQNISGFCLDLGDVTAREQRWFRAILAPAKGFQYTIPLEPGFKSNTPWNYSMATSSAPFSIEKSCEDFDAHDQTPLTSHEALRSTLQLCDRYGVSICQLYAALATAMLLPTHNYLRLDAALPYPIIYDTVHSATEIHYDEFDRLFNDLPYFITLGCAVEVINSSLSGVFWNPDISSNLVSPWIQPVWDLQAMKRVQNLSGRYTEVLSLICAKRVPCLAFLSIAAAISGLTPKILNQVSSGQPPLDTHAHAWTGVAQSFMDITGEGRYYEMHSSKAYILRSDCWRLRRITPLTDDGLYYRMNPFTPWKPPGWGLLKNCPLRTQAHMDCDRHTIAYQGVSWDFHNASTLKNDMGRNLIIPYVPPKLPIVDVSDRCLHLEDQTTSIEATETAFRWVLVNGEGKPAERAYDDLWLDPVFETDSEYEEISNDSDSQKSDAKLKTESWLRHQE
ncbi:hypothetical protein ACLMJK_009357 [Lecanora helva]